MDNRGKCFGMLGLAAKAGKVQSGEFSTEKSVKSGKAFLVIVSEEASDNTKKMFINMCHFYHVPLILYGTKETLGHCIGKEIRAAVAVTDEGFANRIMELMEASRANTEVNK